MWPHLCSKNVVIRIEDIVVQCVSEQNTKRDSLEQLFMQKKFLSNHLSNCQTSIISFFHLEFSTYFFPASNAYPCKFFVYFCFFLENKFTLKAIFKLYF